VSAVTVWTRRPERGSLAMMRLGARLALLLGWRVGRALQYPVVAYFFLFSRGSRAVSRSYLARALGRPPGAADLWRHVFTFGSTILDRVFLLTGRLDGYDIRVSGLEHVRAHVEAGRGCILLGSHLGSFEVLRALADQGCPVPVKALMYEENAARANGLFNALNPGRPAAVIPIGTPDALLRVKEAIDRGELVGILGDRIVSGEKVVAVDFLGAPALLPAGPVVLASVLRAPVVLFFGVHLGPRRYEVRFEPFAEQVTLERGTRAAEVAAWVQRYAHALKAACRAHPYNWFNFYDFWDGGPHASPTNAAPGPRDGGLAGRLHAFLDRVARGGAGHRLPDGDAGGGAGEPRGLR
jgi:predicted LPLAT superfamily acyltransferase